MQISALTAIQNKCVISREIFDENDPSIRKIGPLPTCPKKQI
jgi:hypothetical protein